MKDVVLNEVIDEKVYQKFKKEIGKKDDYLNIEEYKKLLKNWRNFDVLWIKKHSILCFCMQQQKMM